MALGGFPVSGASRETAPWCAGPEPTPPASVRPPVRLPTGRPPRPRGASAPPLHGRSPEGSSSEGIHTSGRRGTHPRPTGPPRGPETEPLAPRADRLSAPAGRSGATRACAGRCWRRPASRPRASPLARGEAGRRAQPPIGPRCEARRFKWERATLRVPLGRRLLWSASAACGGAAAEAGSGAGSVGPSGAGAGNRLTGGTVKGAGTLDPARRIVALPVICFKFFPLEEDVLPRTRLLRPMDEREGLQT